MFTAKAAYILVTLALKCVISARIYQTILQFRELLWSGSPFQSLLGVSDSFRLPSRPGDPAAGERRPQDEQLQLRRSLRSHQDQSAQVRLPQICHKRMRITSSYPLLIFTNISCKIKDFEVYFHGCLIGVKTNTVVSCFPQSVFY